MSASQYGAWESRGDKVDRALWNVANVHHIYSTEREGMACLCGSHPTTKRGATEHILDEAMKALALVGAIPRTDEERNGPELSAYLRSFVGADDDR